MEKIKYLNVKEFTYRIEIDDETNNIYDEKIKVVYNSLNSIKKEIDLYEKLISLSNEEIKKSKSKDDYNTLVNDKKYFINILNNYKNLVIRYGTQLIKLIKKKDKISKLVYAIHYYNDNINGVNNIIKQYNYDIIYDEKNISNIDDISKFKDSILKIIDLNDEFNINIDINILKKEYNKLLYIESYYNCKRKKINELRIDEDNKTTDCEHFIFAHTVLSNEDCSKNNVIGDLDYISYCESLQGRKRITQKIKKVKKSPRWEKIKKSIKQNIKKVVAGLLMSATMIDVSTITAGFDKNCENNLNTKIVSTMDREVNSDIEDATVFETTVNKYEDNKELIKANIDKCDANTKEDIEDARIDSKIQDTEITIGTKVTASSSIYINANDAYNMNNKLTPFYPVSDERKVSLIYYENNEGDTILISNDNKDKIEELKSLKYEVIAYCLDNVTHNVGEGWYNKNDVKVLVK